ncbi:MAG: F0F1 ATP synthase subunit delta [Candidatus Omnitrophota bacterium]
MSFVIPAIVAQVFIFLTLIFIFKGILTKNIVLATKHIDELNQEYSKSEEAAAKKLTEANKSAQEIIAKALNEAQAKMDEAVKKTEEAKQDMLKEARTQAEEIMQQADKSKTALISEIEERIAKEAMKKAAELIQSALPDELKLATHSQWVDDLIDKGFDKIGELKIVEGIKEIKVVTAFPLKEGDRARLLKKVNGLLGKDMGLKEELDPSVVAGIVVEIGSLVLDGSLRNKIQEHSFALDAAKKDAGEQ